MKKSNLRRADLVFSIFLMVLSACTMIRSIGLLLSPFGRSLENVSGDDLKYNILHWYQSLGLVPFIIAVFIFICALFLFYIARKDGAKFDFFHKTAIIGLLKNREFQAAVIITTILSIYVFVLMPTCRAVLDFFPRFQGFPYLVATFLMLFSMMVVFGQKSLKHILTAALISALAATGIAVGFGMLALIPLP